MPSPTVARASARLDARYHEAQDRLSLRQGPRTRRARGQGLGARPSTARQPPPDPRIGIGTHLRKSNPTNQTSIDLPL